MRWITFRINTEVSAGNVIWMDTRANTMEFMSVHVYVIWEYWCTMAWLLAWVYVSYAGWHHTVHTPGRLSWLHFTGQARKWCHFDLLASSTRVWLCNECQLKCVSIIMLRNTTGPRWQVGVLFLLFWINSLPKLGIWMFTLWTPYACGYRWSWCKMKVSYTQCWLNSIMQKCGQVWY